MGSRRVLAIVAAGSVVVASMVGAPGEVRAAPGDVAPAEPAWLRHVGTSQADSLTAIDTDADGNVYVAGSTRGNLAGPGSHAGSTDAVIASYTAGGSQRWLRQLGADMGNQAWDLVVDPAGNSYVVGGTQSAMAGISDPAIGSWDGFVLALDAAGTTRWGRLVGSTKADQAFDVALGPDGQVVVSGWTNGVVADGATADRIGDSFVVQLDPDGSTAWVDQISGGELLADWASGVAVAPDGTVYVSGDTTGVIPGSGASPPDHVEGFLLRYTPAGERVWARQWGGWVLGHEVVVDPIGRPVVAGGSRVAQAGGGGLVGEDDLYVRAFDSDGSTRWVRQFGTTAYDELDDLDIDAAGSLLLTGGSTIASSAPPDPAPSVVGLDPYVVEVDPSGAVQRARLLENAGNDPAGSGGWSADGRVLVAGSTATGLPGATPAAAGSGEGWLGDFGPEGPAPFASWSALVRRLHLDLLGRSATAPEMAQWVEPLRSGEVTPADLVVALRGSDDHTGNVDPIVRLYRAYLLRVPDPGGLGYWIKVRRGGRTLSKISDSFAASSEFTRRYGALSNRQFVELIYENVLGRPGDSAGIAFWTGRLDRKLVGRGSVMLSFSESSEYRRKQVGAVDASVLYLLLAGRTPSAAVFADLTAYGPVVGHEPLTRALASRLLASDAYAVRISGGA